MARYEGESLTLSEYYRALEELVDAAGAYRRSIGAWNGIAVSNPRSRNFFGGNAARAAAAEKHHKGCFHRAFARYKTLGAGLSLPIEVNEAALLRRLADDAVNPRTNSMVGAERRRTYRRLIKAARKEQVALPLAALEEYFQTPPGQRGAGRNFIRRYTARQIVFSPEETPEQPKLFELPPDPPHYRRPE